MKINFKYFGRNYSEKIGLNKWWLNVVSSIFFKKKKKESEFSYNLLDPLLILGEDTGYKDAFLVGDNWLNVNEKKPIALMYGFNDWKYGFVSEYLKEYRTAFLPRKTSSIGLLGMLGRLEEKPTVVVVWGMTESYLVRQILRFRRLPIYRMEDGFIRSSALGAAHATPYSLVLDKIGIYYDSTKSSDIENLLLNYEECSGLYSDCQIDSAMRFVVENGISKYNPADFPKDGISKKIKTRKVVAVIGQVDTDASIKYGNPDGWTMRDLVMLAKREHPEADIFYRPHPEVYKGYQRSRVKSKSIEYFAKIVSPEEPITDFLGAVDHVYTISSTTGLDALIRRIPVTVVGAPFYAGWGLTDDRANIKKRGVTRTLHELFAAAYLVYPRYLANLDDPVTGLKAACLRVMSDKKVSEFELYRKLDNNNIEFIEKKLTSKYWPQLLFADGSAGRKYFDKNIDKVAFHWSINSNPGRLYQLVFLYSICGAVGSNDIRNRFLKKVREYMDPDLLSGLYVDLSEFHPGTYIAEQVSWLLSEHDEYEYSIGIAADELKRLHKDLQREKYLAAVEVDLESAVNVYSEEQVEYSEEQVSVLNGMFSTHIEHKNYHEAIEVGKKIMLTGNLTSVMLLRFAEIAEEIFDTKSARDIAQFQQKVGFDLHNRGGLHLELENMPTNQTAEERGRLVQLYALQMKTNPDRINRSWAIYKSYLRDVGGYKLFESMLRMDNDQSFKKATAYLEIGDLGKARRVIESLARSGDTQDKVSITYSKILYVCKEPEAALRVINRAIERLPTRENFTEKLWILRALGRFEEAESLLKLANVRKFKLTSDGHKMPVYFGLQRIEDGFRCYLESGVRDKLIKYFGEAKYKQTEDLRADKLLLLCCFGPAEEIRYASMYNELITALGVRNFKMACDSRLLSLLQRSFPEMDFVPIKRTRYFNSENPRENYDRLPGAELKDVLDNHGLDVLNESNQIILWSEFIWNFRKKYEDFPGVSYLSWDEDRVLAYRERLPGDRRLVGLCWRSSLTNNVRNVSYLDVEQLAPIFEIDGLQFVNLQYDDCDEELAWINENFPGKIIDFPELDQYNDFDSVAALMKSLDLVISPLSTPIELAGALGCESLVFTNHGEAWWREIDEDKTDVWYHSVKHVRGDLGDKNSLVSALKVAILEWMALTS